MVTRYGLELECVHDNSLTMLEDAKREYHRGEPVDRFNYLWKVERDGSLNLTGAGNFNEPCSCEIISSVFTKEEWKNFFDALVRGVELSMGKKREPFYKFLKFNKSTGAHIHFSSSDDNLTDFICYSHLNNMKKRFFKRLEGAISKPTFDKIASQYYRNYARKSTSTLVDKDNRSLEFNFSNIGKGIEWRSLNLLGVRSWDELHTVLSIAIDEIDKMFKTYKKDKKEHFRVALETNKKNSSGLSLYLEV